jgi:hypothetical protein
MDTWSGLFLWIAIAVGASFALAFVAQLFFWWCVIRAATDGLFSAVRATTPGATHEPRDND